MLSRLAARVRDFIRRLGDDDRLSNDDLEALFRARLDTYLRGEDLPQR